MYLLEKAVIVKSLTTDFSAHVCAFYFLRHVRSLLNCSSNASAAFIPPSTPVSDVGCIIFINLYKFNDSGNIDVDMYAQVQVYRYYKRVSI